MEGKYRIPIERQAVWEALVDPVALKACIPGCKSFMEKAENEYAAEIHTSIGPINSSFTVNITLSDIKPPESYRIIGQGKGAGAAGFASGQATIELIEDGTETELHYTADTKVGGKLAQVGSRLIETAAQKLAGRFFSNFARHLAPDSVTTATGDGTVPAWLWWAAIVTGGALVLVYWLYA
ncbi:MAG: carbon monoxide dehydrogenase subunit G [Arenicellales bacterium]|nr:carbon monoxide dehydrogenase subunit G [Arenicellales bacterium]